MMSQSPRKKVPASLNDDDDDDDSDNGDGKIVGAIE